MKVVAAVQLEVNSELVMELERLLAEAREGKLRGILFAANRVAGDRHYGSSGEYSLADYALGLKLMELELDSIVTRGQEPG